MVVSLRRSQRPFVTYTDVVVVLRVVVSLCRGCGRCSLLRQCYHYNTEYEAHVLSIQITSFD